MQAQATAARQAVTIGHPGRHIELPVAARFECEPHPDVLNVLLRAGYVVYREVCVSCEGSGKLGNSTLDCLGCGGRGMPAHLLAGEDEA